MASTNPLPPQTCGCYFNATHANIVMSCFTVNSSSLVARARMECDARIRGVVVKNRDAVEIDIRKICSKIVSSPSARAVFRAARNGTGDPGSSTGSTVSRSERGNETEIENVKRGTIASLTRDGYRVSDARSSEAGSCCVDSNSAPDVILVTIPRMDAGAWSGKEIFGTVGVDGTNDTNGSA